MTIRQVIDRLDSRMANTFTNSDKVAWLSAADSMINASVFSTGGTEYSDADLDAYLLAPAPFDEMYLHYLEAMIHYQNGENDRYNAAITMFNKFFDDFAAWNIRSNAPQKKACRFVF